MNCSYRGKNDNKIIMITTKTNTGIRKKKNKYTGRRRTTKRTRRWTRNKRRTSTRRLKIRKTRVRRRNKRKATTLG